MNAVMKDIISPTFLPSIEAATVFNILVYTRESHGAASRSNPSLDIPDGWEATHPHAVEEAEHDTLKALNAPRHHVGLSVAYRDED